MADSNSGSLMSRALRLRCPRCGVGPLFKSLLVMHSHCPHCSLKYERAPGYFLGSTYLNYGFMVITMTSAYMALHYGAHISNKALTVPLLIYCLIMPLILFRYARAWWLAADCYMDPVGFGLKPEPAPAPESREPEDR
ncbi:DUF983 domain-containing protein [Schlesneria sp. T3-172]|uniref:DUF983 domain-containing protein n=1 Tax=Schlesneria sphaerica TaxID=3373610 RepID=UPI0037C540F0